MRFARLPVLALAVVGALALFGPAGAAASTAASTPALTGVAAPAEIGYGHSTTIGGRLVDATAPAGGRSVVLQASPYPYRTYRLLSTTTTAPDGTYSFRVRPDRNSRFRVTAAASSQTVVATLQVVVDAREHASLRYLPLGRVRVSISLLHPTDLRWGGRIVYWFETPGRSRIARLVARTRTRERRAGLTILQATFAVPAGLFRYRACFNVAGEQALGPLDAHRRCPHRGYREEGHGHRPR